MNRAPVPPWKRLLERKSAEHYRRFHSETPTFTRRGFLSTAVGAAGFAAVSQLSLTPYAVGDKIQTAEPKPIPGGAVPFGIVVHHNPPASRTYNATSQHQ